MTTYVSILSTCTKEQFEDRTGPLYTSLVPLITEDELTDAHDSALAFSIDYAAIFPTIECRPVKALSRVMAKAAAGRPISAFQANTDLMAFRIPCKLTDIDTNVNKLSQVVAERGGHFMLKCPYMANGAYTDIVAFCYAYIPDYKYIMEFQIGEPFALYTFARDSALRDDPSCGLVDLWSNDFYAHVVKQLLKTSVYDLNGELNALYAGRGTPEPELSTMIHNISYY